MRITPEQAGESFVVIFCLRIALCELGGGVAGAIEGFIPERATILVSFSWDWPMTVTRRRTYFQKVGLKIIAAAETVREGQSSWRY